MKRILVALLTCMVCVTIFASCGNNSSNKSDDETGVTKVIDIDLTSEEYAFGVDKDQPELLDSVNEFIAEIKSNGKFDEICNKYFSDSEPTPVKSAELDSSKDQLVVATNAAFEPFEYKDGESYLGIDMEIASLLADKLGKELVIQNMDFDAVCLSVGQHKCDIAMSGLTVKEDRKEYVDFSDSYYPASQKIVVKSDDTTFDKCKSAEEIEAILKSKDLSTKIGVQNGTTGQKYVQGDEDWEFDGFAVTCVGYKNGSLAIQDMVNGNIDWVIIDSAPATCITDAINKMSHNKIDTFKKAFITGKGYKTVVQGLRNTIIIAVLGLIIGILIGTLIATVRVLPKYRTLPKVLNSVCSVYVGFFRGTPMVVQLLVFYYVLMPIVGLKLPSVTVAIWVFGFNSGAYISEIMRGGIMSVDPGQMEGGRSVGLGYATTMVRIIIPQAIKNILPTMGNEFVALIKETSVVSFIGATDLYVAFNNIGSSSYEFMVPYLVMAIIYIVLVLLITLLIRITERSLRKSDRGR